MASTDEDDDFQGSGSSAEEDAQVAAIAHDVPELATIARPAAAPAVAEQGEAGGTDGPAVQTQPSPAHSGSNNHPENTSSNVGPSTTLTEEQQREVMRAEEQSVLGRSHLYVPYNPWLHDGAHESQMEEIAPVELTAEQVEIRRRLQRLQEDNATKLKHYDALGYNFDPGARNNGTVALAHSEDDSIVYACGRHIACVGITSTDRRFLLRAENCIAVNCFCCSSNGKYIAVSERRVDAAYVTVYKLDSCLRVASLNFKFLAKSQVVALCFSSNNKYIATLCGAPDNKLLMWQLDDVKVIAMQDASSEFVMDCVTVNPWNSLQLCATSSKGHFFVMKVLDRKLVPTDVMLKGHYLWEGCTCSCPPRFVAHTWYDEECVAALTNDGVVALCESEELKALVNVIVPVKGIAVTFSQMVWASRGLVIAGSNGILVLLDRTHSSTYFQQVAIFRANPRAEIRALSVSPAEVNIVVALSNNSIEYVLMDTLNDAIAEAEEHALEFEAQACATMQASVITSASILVPSGTASPDASLRAASFRHKTQLVPIRNDVPCGVVVRAEVFHPIGHVGFHSDLVTSLSTVCSGHCS